MLNGELLGEVHGEFSPTFKSVVTHLKKCLNGAVAFFGGTYTRQW